MWLQFTRKFWQSTVDLCLFQEPQTRTFSASAHGLKPTNLDPKSEPKLCTGSLSWGRPQGLQRPWAAQPAQWLRALEASAAGLKVDRLREQGFNDE